MKVDAEQKQTLKRVVARFCLYSALFLLSFVFFNLLIATIFFIFNISIQSWYAIVSGILAGVLVTFMMKRGGFLNWKLVFGAVIAPIVMIIGLTFVNGKVYDSTHDGNNYHKLTIGMMMDGWNPLYETISEFDDRTGNPIELDGETFHWGDYYAKASHIFAANIGMITGSVESGKVFNDISVVVVFLLFMTVCLYCNKTWIFSILFSSIAVTAPTISGQFLTNYVDILVYLYMFALASIFFAFEYLKEYKKEFLIVFFVTIVVLINIKFSSFAYAGILCVVYYIWYIYRYRKDPKFSKRFFKFFSITGAVAVIVGVFVVGLSVYPRNFITHGHPFYPLMGEGKRDIMTMNSPDYFKEKNNLERFIIATFSEMDNISEASGLEAKYKVPFSITEEEFKYLGYSDLRISGNGMFFSGILIVSVIILLIFARRLFLDNRNLFMLVILPIAMTTVMIFVMSDVWWPRYFPQLYFIIFAALITINEYMNTFARVALYVLIGLILVNNIMYLSAAVEKAFLFSSSVRAEFSAYRNLYSNEKCILVLGTDGFPGSYYDARHAFGDYDIMYVKWDPKDGDGYVALINPFLIGKCREK